MKCELCNERPAELALKRESDEGEEELYVCRRCAAAERSRRQPQAPRKPSGATVNMEISMTEAPPIVKAIVSAFEDMVDNVVREKCELPAAEAAPGLRAMPLDEVEAELCIDGRLHLEGLYLIGEHESVQRALGALGMQLEGLTIDGVRDAGKAFSLMVPAVDERAKRVLAALCEQELNARRRLREEMGRVYDDALFRALAVLKNCRLLSPGDLYDLLSPLWLAVCDGRLEGITKVKLERLRCKLDLTSGEDGLAPEERDRVDGERADEINRVFASVTVET